MKIGFKRHKTVPVYEEFHSYGRDVEPIKLAVGTSFKQITEEVFCKSHRRYMDEDSSSEVLEVLTSEDELIWFYPVKDIEIGEQKSLLPYPMIQNFLPPGFILFSTL